MTVADDLTVDGLIVASGNEIRGSYSLNKLTFPATQRAAINDVFFIHSSGGRGTLQLVGNTNRVGSNTLFGFSRDNINEFKSDHTSYTYTNIMLEADAVIAFPGSVGATVAQDLSIFKSNITSTSDHGYGKRLFLDFRNGNTPMFTADMSGSIYAFGNISGSAASTGSFGKLLGDASDLTNLPAGYTVSNEANNRIVTSTGTAAGNAEASLLFDGSTLTHSTSGNFIKQSFTGGGAASGYNYFINAYNDQGLRAVHFVNGSSRTADNGVNTYTIRNDGGPLHLGRSNYATIVEGTTITFKTATSISGSAASTGSFGRIQTADGFSVGESGGYTSLTSTTHLFIGAGSSTVQMQQDLIPDGNASQD